MTVFCSPVEQLCVVVCACLMSTHIFAYLSMLDSTLKTKFWRYVERWLCNLYDGEYDIILFRHKQKNHIVSFLK